MTDLVSVAADATTGVGVVTMLGAPNNYLNRSVLDAVVAGLGSLDADPTCAAIVLAAEGKHFCAGRDFTAPRGPGDDSASIYRVAAHLLRIRTPWVAAVQGGAIGAGCGLALAADFRVCAESAFFWPNFVTHGLHHGFGTTVTLPRVVGPQRAARMLMTGAKVSVTSDLGEGLADLVSPADALLDSAVGLAAQLAGNPPEAMVSIRQTLRGQLYEEFVAATAHEFAEQTRLVAARAATRARPGG